MTDKENNRHVKVSNFMDLTTNSDTRTFTPDRPLTNGIQ